MNRALWFAGGLALGVFLVANIKRANESSCCQRVAFAGRDVIADFAGPASPLVAGVLDAFGLTKHIPGILDTLGVPTDAV